jgi:hypothetical protein
VNPGVTNHMKLAIADGSDDNLDSAVFLEGESLVSGTGITTSLSGGGQTGPAITVPPNTAVSDTATLSGANSAQATGSVDYKVYSDASCMNLVSDQGTVAVNGQMVPASNSATLGTPGTYYWQAAYSGDSLNNPVTSACGSEIETVKAPKSKPTCTLAAVKVGPPSQLVYTAQDAVAGLASIGIRDHNSTNVISGFSPGTTGLVTITFTKRLEPLGGRDGVVVTNTQGKKVTCLGQWKTLRARHFNSQGFTFQGGFSNLVIQNGKIGLIAAHVTLNETPTVKIPLTPGETFTETLTGLVRTNHMVVQGLGKVFHEAVHRAVVVVWGHPQT